MPTMMTISPHISIRKPGAVLLALLLALLPTLVPDGSGSGISSMRAASLEHQIKAAFLLNFTYYVAFPKKSGDLRICVLGPDVFGSALQDVVAGKSVNGRSIVVRRSLSLAEAAGCDMVYISLAEARQIRDALKALESSPVFTVGEDTDFLRMGGMIAFANLEGKVRFYINASAAERAGIGISSRLMVLGKNLRDEGERRR